MSLLTLATIAQLGHAALTRAYTGGTITVDVLGWDSRSGRVYCHQLDHSESGGSRNRIYFFDLRSTKPGVPHVLGWSRGQALPTSTEDSLQRVRKYSPGWRPSPDESLFKVRLIRLRGNLRPVPIEKAGPYSTLMSREVAQSDTLFGPNTICKTTAEIKLGCGVGQPSTHYRITSYGTPGITCTRRYELPERLGHLLILEYRGTAWNEEVQRAVWVPCDSALATQMLDEPWGVP